MLGILVNRILNGQNPFEKYYIYIERYCPYEISLFIRPCQYGRTKTKRLPLPEQEDRLLKYCNHNDIKVKGIYREDFSAKNFNRPERKKLIAMVKKKSSHEENNILFIKWDRFSRNIRMPMRCRHIATRYLALQRLGWGLYWLFSQLRAAHFAYGTCNIAFTLNAIAKNNNLLQFFCLAGQLNINFRLAIYRDLLRGITNIAEFQCAYTMHTDTLSAFTSVWVPLAVPLTPTLTPIRVSPVAASVSLPFTVIFLA